jgi:predicted GIY-YIG superfamily endonuclease
MKPFFVYILECNDGSYYIGQTDDLSHRIDQHMQNDKLLGNYVSKRMPFKLVYVAEFETRDEARELERQLKGWTRKKKQALISGGFDAVRNVMRKQ